ncbi:C40 family peptidase [Paucilactobacillus kaifaensis]|uniref:C40 family peptidase n=1 Tax=Paucilactobacillus kaifaensis TaxID=2559921 RepID=UPI0010F65A45|nr:C40 family peptidase [Paucilactobacillus kaifaensis]
MTNSHISNTNKYAKNVVLGTVGALGLFAVGTQGVKADTVKVQAGDTVWDFAQKYGVSVNDLEAQNTGIKKISSSVDLIYAGQTLNLSKSTTAAQSSAAVSSSTTSASSSSAVVNGKYTVQSGDTLSALSSRFGVSIATLQRANGLSDSNLIVVGQVLNVSSDETTAVASSANSTVTSAAASSATNDTSVSASSETASSATATVTSSSTTSATSVASSASAISSSSVSANSNSAVATSSATAASSAISSNTATSQSSSATAASNNISTTANSNLQTGSVVSLAVKLANAGIPYVWGGNSLSGMDCSGLVQYVYAHSAGINLPHNTVAQEAYVTKHSVASAKPGDILFWGNSGATYHDAIYIGNNQFVAAPTSGQNVKVQTISSYFMPSFAGTVK